MPDLSSSSVAVSPEADVATIEREILRVLGPESARLDERREQRERMRLNQSDELWLTALETPTLSLIESRILADRAGGEAAQAANLDEKTKGLVIDTIQEELATEIEHSANKPGAEGFLGLRRPDLGHLEVEITFEDVGALKKPWKTKTVATLAPNNPEIGEYICNENNQDVEHLIGK
jgi:hypothetical protein